jgi:ApbE superfamily uncharacterized protein (UPF0280 family)
VHYLKLLTAYWGYFMRKIIVLVEVFALAAIPVTAIAINPQTAQMMVAASQAANPPQERLLRKIIAFAQAAGTVAALTIHPQSAKPWPQ